MKRKSYKLYISIYLSSKQVNTGHIDLPQLILQQVTDKEGNSHIMGFKGAWKANNAFYQEQGAGAQAALNKRIVTSGENNS